MSAAVLLFGCDSDCENVCEAAQECNLFDFVELFIRLDCDDMCDFLEEDADAHGCADHFHEYYGCLADGQRDQCLFVDPCSAERAAYDNCMGR